MPSDLPRRMLPPLLVKSGYGPAGSTFCCAMQFMRRPLHTRINLEISRIPRKVSIYKFLQKCQCWLTPIKFLFLCSLCTISSYTESHWSRGHHRLIPSIEKKPSKMEVGTSGSRRINSSVHILYDSSWGNHRDVSSLMDCYMVDFLHNFVWFNFHMFSLYVALVYAHVLPEWYDKQINSIDTYWQYISYYFYYDC